mgnify:CR=1 FL=1
MTGHTAVREQIVPTWGHTDPDTGATRCVWNDYTWLLGWIIINSLPYWYGITKNKKLAPQPGEPDTVISVAVNILRLRHLPDSLTRPVCRVFLAPTRHKRAGSPPRS